MSEFNYIESLLHLEEGTVVSCMHTSSSLQLILAAPSAPCRCPHCKGTRLHVKDYRMQRIQLALLNNQPVYAFVRKKRYRCTHCGRTCYAPLSFLDRYQRRSRTLQRELWEECRRKQSFSDIASRYHISIPTVIRHFSALQCASPQSLPSVLAIDEFHGNASGQQYQVLLTNPVTHRILDVLPERHTGKIIQYFLRYSRKQRQQVKFVVMDLSSVFRKVARIVFPNAVIVGDRFHIIRLIRWAMERVRKQVQHMFWSKRLYFKRQKTLLSKPGRSLTEEEAIRVADMLRRSDDLRRAYALKEAFYKVLSMSEKQRAEDMLTQWLELVQAANLPEFSSLLRSFADWKEPIVQAIIQPYSNGFTEGINNKIKVLKRISFGIRKFEILRNRILLLV